MSYPVLIEGPKALAKLVVNGWIVDGRSGGIVRGRLHTDGHILMIQPNETLGAYEFIGYMEGGEYLMSTTATAVHMKRLNEINNDNGEAGASLPQSLKGRVIDTAAEPHDKLLIVHRQFVINRSSTIKHFDELVTLNAEYPFYSGRIFNDEELTAINAMN